MLYDIILSHWEGWKMLIYNISLLSVRCSWEINYRMITMAKKLVKNLEEQFECPVCMDTFDDPRVLSCLHTFCKRCIERIELKRRGDNFTIQCPNCRKETEVRNALVSWETPEQNGLVCFDLPTMRRTKYSRSAAYIYDVILWDGILLQFKPYYFVIAS